MVNFIENYREFHAVKNGDEYRRVHAAFMQKRRAKGPRYEVHEVADPAIARIDSNRWLIDCECGAGNLTDPDIGFACCFLCGAVHTQITFPDTKDRADIETALLARIRPSDRFWKPGETADDLKAENESPALRRRVRRAQVSEDKP